MRGFHNVLGLLLSVLYVLLLARPSHLLPKLPDAAMMGWVRPYAHAGTGLLVIYALPLAAIACFLMPRQLMVWFSPRVPPSYEYLLTESFWYLAGYFLLATAVGVLLLFR